MKAIRIGEVIHNLDSYSAFWLEEPVLERLVGKVLVRASCPGEESPTTIFRGDTPEEAERVLDRIGGILCADVIRKD